MRVAPLPFYVVDRQKSCRETVSETCHEKSVIDVFLYMLHERCLVVARKDQCCFPMIFQNVVELFVVQLQAVPFVNDYVMDKFSCISPNCQQNN